MFSRSKKTNTRQEVLDDIDQITKEFNLPPNSLLCQSNNVLDHLINIHLTRKQLAILILGYQRSFENKDAPFCGQVAKPCQLLRVKGFVFKKGNPRSREYTFTEKGIEYRKIIGIDPARSMYEADWNKLNKEQKKLFKKYKHKDFRGRALNKSEIDHRMPENTRRNLGIAPTPLTPKSLIDGTAHNLYQIVTPATNDEKREACTKCQRHEIIPLPEDISLFASGYKREWDGTCEGCYWYNFLCPQNSDVFPTVDLQEVQDNEKELRNNLSKIIESTQKNRKLVGKWIT